jgi:hypothetical protein
MPLHKSSGRRLDKVYHHPEAENQPSSIPLWEFKKPHFQNDQTLPQKSSHLRFGSHGEFDEATLGQLEGKPAPKKIHSHRPRGSRHIEMEGDSASAADNERSSGTSSDSDTTLSQKIQIHPNLSRHSLLPQHEDRHNPSLSLSNVPSPKPVRSSLPLQSSKAEYFSIPIDSPGYETSDPFATPLSSPGERSHSFNSAQSAVVHSPVLPDKSTTAGSILLSVSVCSGRTTRE